MIRPRTLVHFFWALLLPLASSCGKPTEIVVRLSAEGGTPPSIVVKLHRMTPFADNPMQTPSYVTAQLDGADLDLIVTPPGPETVLSLLPAKSASSDLRVSVSAPGWAVSPSTPVDATFADGKSQEMVFVLTAPPPDGGVKDAAGDAGKKTDGGDASMPVDLAPGKG